MTTPDTSTQLAVQELCAETLRLPIERVKPDARFVDDLDADSLFIVQLTIAVEERFNISVSDDEARDLQTVQDMVDFVAKKVQG